MLSLYVKFKSVNLSCFFIAKIMTKSLSEPCFHP